MAKAEQLSFGVAGLAAALQLAPDEVRAQVRAGRIKAEFVEQRGPRWSPTALVDIIKEQQPVRGADPAGAALDRTRQGLLALLALERAYQAEKGGTACS